MLSESTSDIRKTPRKYSVDCQSGPLHELNAFPDVNQQCWSTKDLQKRHSEIVTLW